MRQLPIFLNMAGRKIVLVGKGEAAAAKRTLLERAGAQIVGIDDPEARLAFVAVENDAEAERTVTELKQRGLLVNAVDRPQFCDFTTPAIVDRDPVLLAIGTGGASAGLAKSLRQDMERLLPASLGRLAQALFAARPDIARKWSDASARRRAIDAALVRNGPLDPFTDYREGGVEDWLAKDDRENKGVTIEFTVNGPDPDELTLRQARWLASADRVYFEDGVSPDILARARADAVRLPLNDGAPAALSGDILVVIRSAGAA